MNRQPYRKTGPEERWESLLDPAVVAQAQPQRIGELRDGQRLRRWEFRGLEHLRDPLTGGTGVLITPNHSFHFDSFLLAEAAHSIGRPGHCMTAWQVFGMSDEAQRRAYQLGGCFSINREVKDGEALKQAVRILTESPFPLTIFPEGDMYHANDRVRPFQSGAAGIALLAAARAKRPVVVTPVAIKFWFVADPRPALAQVAERLEARFRLPDFRPADLAQRGARLVDAFASSGLGARFAGFARAPFPQRVDEIRDAVLADVETRHGLRNDPTMVVPERLRVLRQQVVGLQTGAELSVELLAELDLLFFASQLYSHEGTPWAEPTLEQLAEIFDRLEEDALDAIYPGIRGDRVAAVAFGEPISVAADGRRPGAEAELTTLMQARVQGLLDELNRQPPSEALTPPR